MPKFINYIILFSVGCIWLFGIVVFVDAHTEISLYGEFHRTIGKLAGLAESINSIKLNPPTVAPSLALISNLAPAAAPNLAGLSSFFDAPTAFAQTFHKLTVERNGAATAARVLSSPGGIDCGGWVCSYDFLDVGWVELYYELPADPTLTWLGCDSLILVAGNPPKCKVTMTAPRTVTATPSYTLTVQKTGNDIATVSSSPAGINCGSTCGKVFVWGNVVDLAYNSIDPTLTWLGCDSLIPVAGNPPKCRVTMYSNRIVTAAMPVTLTVQKTGFAAPAAAITARVRSSPAGMDCGSTCDRVFTNGEVAELYYESPPADPVLTWFGCDSLIPVAGNPPRCRVTMNNNRTVTATPSYILTVQKTGTTATNAGVTSSPAGINCGSTCSQTFAGEEEVILTLTPPTPTPADYYFLTWGGCTSLIPVANNPPKCQVTMNSNKTVIASPPYKSLTVVVGSGSTGSGTITGPVNAKTGSGINCAISGASKSGDCSEVYFLGTQLTFTATPGANSTFGSWSGLPAASVVSGCGTSQTCIFTLNDTTNLSASFVLGYRILTVSQTGSGFGNVEGMGINCGDSGTICSKSYINGTSVTLKATPGANSTFGSWSGVPAASVVSGCGTNLTCTFTLNDTTNLSFQFNTSAALAQTAYTLTLTTTGSGSVASEGIAGINCGTTCSASYPKDTIVKLKAALTGASTFIAWRGCSVNPADYLSCFAIMDRARTVSAKFYSPAVAETTTFTLNMFKSGSGIGTISGPDNISCGAGCNSLTKIYSYPAGPQTKSLVLTAVPGANSIFSDWSGDCTGTDSCVIKFDCASYTLTVSKSSTGNGTVTGIGNLNCTSYPCTKPYTTGTSVVLNASPADDSTFASWTGCTPVSGVPTQCTVTMDAVKAVTATFNLKPLKKWVFQTITSGTCQLTTTCPSASPAGTSCSTVAVGATCQVITKVMMTPTTCTAAFKAIYECQYQ